MRKDSDKSFPRKRMMARVCWHMGGLQVGYVKSLQSGQQQSTELQRCVLALRKVAVRLLFWKFGSNLKVSI